MLGPSGSRQDHHAHDAGGLRGPATHGEIYLAGRPINNVPPHKRGIGLVFQNYALFPAPDGRVRIVAFPLSRSAGIGEAGGRSSACGARAAQWSKLPTTSAHRRPAQLSGGQQQRVALAARALVFEPDARADGRAPRRARTSACASPEDCLALDPV